MSRKDEFFKSIDAVLKSSSWKPEDVASVLGVKARFKKISENAYFSVYRASGAPGSAITAVELRVNRDGTRGGMVLIDVAPSLGVNNSDILSRFGKSPEVSAPSAHAPKNTPSYFVYANPGGELSFGLAMGKPTRLTRVVLDRSPKSAADDQ